MLSAPRRAVNMLDTPAVVSYNRPMTTTPNARSIARKQFLHDVFITALEGGIGYWSEAETYHWSNPDGTEDLDGFYADIIETGDGDANPFRIDIDVIARGVNRISKAKTFYDPNGPDHGAEKGEIQFLGKGTARAVRDASFENDSCEIDAGDADVIVQVALFGEVKYG